MRKKGLVILIILLICVMFSTLRLIKIYNTDYKVIEYFVKNLEILDCAEKSGFRRICLFTRYMKKECMICFGDLSAEYKSAIYENINKLLLIFY